ncbi:hypothetical protein DXG03_006267 [Asterophora parasitica]|uniref:Uncharacterized protein n=1 Tax=Asterophora parasitica TaxID=117018 RepID=A0A9P7G8G5_9AGAR|nr:hypothetical protein DXG03_006267 [Asterophora parasitica]
MHLRMLSGTWNYLLPLEFLDAISRLYGPSLQGMYWNDHPSIITKNSSASLEFLGSFSSLRVLDLCNFWGEINRKLSPALPEVQTLIISDADHSLAAATALLLPSLQNLILKAYSHVTPVHLLGSFLNVHGASLVTLDLPSPASESDPEPANTSHIRRAAAHTNVDIFLQNNRCPNLMTLTFPVTSPPLSSDIKHPLRRIGLRGVRAGSLYPDKPTPTRRHLMSFTPDRYPKLEVVKTVDFLVDADTDSSIKDVFIWWVEKFEKQAVDFLDGEGVLWEYAPDSSLPLE